MKLSSCAAALAALTLVPCAAAEAHHARHRGARPAPVLWSDYAHHPAGYLGPADRPDALAFLPPPPAADSPSGNADRATYEAMKALKGSPRWTEATADAEVETPGAPRACTCAAGVELDPKRTPATSLLLARVMADVAKAEDHAKDTYARKRPFLADDGDICVDKADWLVKQGSYPSGHAATGWAWALILSELEPGRTEALLKRGVSFGQSRVVCRVHFASDVEAGRTFGSAVVARLHANPAFLTDMKRANEELAAARGAAPAGCTAEKVAAGER